MTDLEYIDKQIRNAEILAELSVSDLAKERNNDRLERLKRIRKAYVVGLEQTTEWREDGGI